MENLWRPVPTFAYLEIAAELLRAVPRENKASCSIQGIRVIQTGASKRRRSPIHPPLARWGPRRSWASWMLSGAFTMPGPSSTNMPEKSLWTLLSCLWARMRRCSRTSATHSWSTSMGLFQPLRCLGQQMLMCFSYGRASARVSLSLSSQMGGGAEFIAFSKFPPARTAAP